MGRLALMITVNLLIWLGLNLITFIVVSFFVFVLLNLMGAAHNEYAFTYALLCAIPSALTVSGIITGRRVVRQVRSDFN